MWFIGLILGGMLGVLFDSEAVTIIGSAAGLALGLLYGEKYSAQKHSAQNQLPGGRLDTLERRISELELQVAALQRGESVRKFDQKTTPVTKPVVTAPEKSEPIAEQPEVAPPAADNTPVWSPPPAVAAAPLLAYEPVPQARANTAQHPQKAPNPVLHWLLTGEHAIARIGVVILFIGIGFLVKYAADHALFPIELRLASAVLVGIALLIVGWRLRIRHAAYALILQGGGVGILYLVIYGALQIWHLLPAGLAFTLLIGIAVLSTLLAVWQDAMALALFGVTGGFLAPLLTATESGNHVALFSYYTILNLGIFTAAWFKSWRLLNLLGFIFTFAIALLWGAQNYRPELFAGTEPFLVLFFLLYVAIALLYALRRVLNLNDYVDGGLIFGVPVVGFGLQAALVSDFEYGLAISSLVLGAFYMSLAKFIQLRRRDDLRLLVESFLALGVIFATLAIPLACDAQWTSAAWAVEGAGVFWFGSRRNKLLAWSFGLLLQAGAGVAFMLHTETVVLPDHPVNHLLIGAWLLALSGFVSYRAALRQKDNEAMSFCSVALFLWGLAWWLYGGLDDIYHYAAFDFHITIGLLFLTVTAMLSSVLALRWQWPHGEWPVMAFTPVLWIAALSGILNHDHPFAHLGWLAWAIALIAHYWLLHRHETVQPLKLHDAFHTWSFLLLAALGAWEMHWLSGEYQLQHNAWSVASLIVVPIGLLTAVSSPALGKFWPLNRHLEAYRQNGALPVVIALWLWTFYANLTHDGASQPLPYLPLLNALDIGHGLVIIAVGAWLLKIRSTRLYDRQFVIYAGGAALFVWLNAILLRTIHHWAGVAYDFDVLMQSMLVQTALSLFWTLLAMMLMVIAARRGMRTLWLTGVTLMGVVLVKLLLVDLAQSGTLERIISFTGVGLLMLLIGYFAPFPKKETP